MIKTLRRKFVTVAMLSVTLVLSLIVLGINTINYISVLQTADERLQFLTDNGGSLDQKEPRKDAPMNRDDKEPPSNSGKKFFASSALSEESFFDTRYFTVTFDDNDRVVASNIDSIATVSEDSAISIAKSVRKSGRTTGTIEGDYRFTTLDTDNGTMYIFLDFARERASFKNFMYISIFIFAVGIGLVFILVLFFSRIVFKPVVESYEKQRQFITDASHDLKTPLAIIDANTEVLEMEIDDADNRWIKSIRKQTGRLLSLTERLVMLSRMDEVNPRLEMSDVNLSLLVDEAVDSFQSLATKNGKNIECDIDTDIHIRGDYKSLQQMTILLLENAIKYSDDSGRISVYLRKINKHIELTFFNTVNNITPGKHPEMFERFYRMDESRNSKTGGFGIGLSVVRAIVKNHKGSILAIARDSKSIEFVVRFGVELKG